MASRKIYARYKVLIHALGLKQVDVYRFNSKTRKGGGEGEGGGARDVLRIADPLSNKVALIDLGTVREALSYSEFLERVIEGLRKAGIAVSERRIAAAREKAKAMDEAAAPAKAQAG